MIMHREIVQAKKVKAILITLIAITIALYAIEITELTLGNKIIGYQIIQGLAIILIIGVVFKEYKRCKFAFKYSIIADKLIINKICTKNNSNLESIKIDNILFVGEKQDIPKEYKNVKSKGVYVGDCKASKKCYCIYKTEGGITKFAFQPSERLLKRINDRILINKKEAV